VWRFQLRELRLHTLVVVVVELLREEAREPGALAVAVMVVLFQIAALAEV
jgi:hypothetical protein